MATNIRGRKVVESSAEESDKKRDRESDDDELSEVEQRPVKKVSRRQESASSTASSGRFQESDADADDENDEPPPVSSTAPKPVKGTYHNKNLTQLAKVEKQLHELQVNKASVMNIAGLMEFSMSDLFEGGFYGKKQYNIVLSSSGSPEVSPHKRAKKPTVLKMVMQGPNNSKFNLPFIDNVDEDQLQEAETAITFAGLFETFYNNLAALYPNDAFANQLGLHLVVIDLAISKALPNMLDIASPLWDKEKGLKISLPYMDPDTGEREWYRWTLRAPIELRPDAPALPANARFYQRAKALSDKEYMASQTDTCVPDDILQGTAKEMPGSKHSKEGGVTVKDPRKYLDTENFMRLCSWKLSNLVCSHKQMKQMKEHFERVYTTDPQREIHEGRPQRSAGMGLFTFERHGDRAGVVILPSAPMLRALKTDINIQTRINIRMISMDAQWIATVLETAKQSYIANGSMLEVLLGVAQTVDQANSLIRHGELPPNRCSCTDEMSKTIMHICSGCMRDTLCKHRQRNSDGMFVCDACYQKNSGDNVVQRRAKATLKREVGKEALRLGQDPDDQDNRQIRDEATDDILKQLGNQSTESKYLDGYTQQEYETFLGFYPTNQCIDGVLPSYPDHRMQLRNHVKENLLPTNNSLNMGKGPARRNLPADLSSASNFRRELKANGPVATDLAKMRKELLRDCDSHNEVQCKYKLNPSAQRGVVVSKQQWNAMRTEFVSGKLSSADDKVNDAAKQHARRILLKSDIVPCGWDDDVQALIKRLADQAGVDQRARDGAPFPFVDVDMTDEFYENGWDMLFSLMRLRLNRMTLECNRYWATIDTELTLLAEWLYQVVYEREKGKEFLNLPVTCYINHALLASVAHKHHGKQMRTGYKPNLKDLFDRDDEVCNILIETVLSNFLKMDFDEKYYPEIVTMFDNVQVPERFFNPTLPPPKSTVFKTAAIPDEPDFAVGDMHPVGKEEADRFNKENENEEL